MPVLRCKFYVHAFISPYHSFVSVKVKCKWRWVLNHLNVFTELISISFHDDLPALTKMSFDWYYICLHLVGMWRWGFCWRNCQLKMGRMTVSFLPWYWSLNIMYPVRLKRIHYALCLIFQRFHRLWLSQKWLIFCYLKYLIKQNKCIKLP